MLSMAFRKLLMNVCLMIAINIGFNGQDVEGYDMLKNNQTNPLKNLIEPKEYTIVIRANMTDKKYIADIYAIFELTQKVHFIRFRSGSSNMTNFSLIRLNDNTFYEIKSIQINNDLEITTLRMPFKINSGVYKLYMNYIGYLDHNDIADVDEYKWFSLTLFNPSKARQLPCWGEPKINAIFKIIVITRLDFAALSNMNVKEKHEFTNSTIFYATPPIPLYLMEIIVTNYKNITTKNGSITIWCKPDIMLYAKFALDVAGKVSSVMEQYTLRPWDVPKIDLVVIPEKLPTKQKHGIIIISEKQVLYDEKLDSVNRKIEVAIEIARQLVHQWLGNIINPPSCDDQWFNEVLASYFQMYTLNKVFPEWRMMDFFAVQYQQLSFQYQQSIPRVEIDLRMNPLSEDNIVTKNNTLAFQVNVPFMMRMLQLVFTEDEFRRSVITYIYKYEFSTGTSEDFWTTLKQITTQLPNLLLHRHCSLEQMMHKWLIQSDYPVVTVIRNYKSKFIFMAQNNVDVNIRGRQTHRWIPITFATQSKPDFSITTSQHYLAPSQILMLTHINKDDWIIVNVQQIGYYRVRYDADISRQIVNYLNSDKYTNIHPINRAQLIDDSYHFAETDTKKKLFFDIMSYLRRETDYVAWYPMKRILPHLWEVYKITDFDSLKEFILSIWDSLLDDVGYIENPEDEDITKMKRLFAIEWACKWGHKICRERTHAKLIELVKTNMEESEEYIHRVNESSMPLERTYKTSPVWNNRIYCAGLITANLTIALRVFKRYVNLRDLNALEYVPCSENIEILESFLLIIETSTNLENINKNRDENYETAYRNVIKNHIDNNIVFNYIISNFMKIKPRTMSKFTVLTLIIKNIHYLELLDKVALHFKDEFKENHALPALLSTRRSNILQIMEDYKIQYWI